MPEVVNDHARVPIEEIVVYTQNNNIKINTNPRNTFYRMRKQGGQWQMLAPNTPMPPSASQ
jgi:hypothetical protein